MKDRRAVALTLAFIAVFFFFRAGFAYWVLGHIIPIAELMQLPYEDPGNAERFAQNLRFSITLFGILGLVAAITCGAVILRQRWARWVWLVTCTVMSFSYLYTLLVSPELGIKQYDIILVCGISWFLLRGGGLSRTHAP
jgi:hypothetical protein